MPSDGDAARSMDLVRFAPQPAGSLDAVVDTPAAERVLALSPDEHWLAYASDQTGRAEIWVRPYPGPGAAIRVSANGGDEPVWAKNGRELFFIEGLSKLMSVPVNTKTGITFGAAVPLADLFHRDEQPPSYDVASDGRFIAIKSDESTDVPTTVIVNWAQTLRR
jgi:hypothetical protein